MRSPTTTFFALVCVPAALLAPLAWTAPARADASSWVAVGGGAINWKQGGGGYALHGALSFDAGVGTTPDAPFIFGGLARVTPILGSGTDLALLARVATRGFQAAELGLALDAGGYARFWGEGSGGFTGSLTLGAPLGFNLSLQASVGTHDALAFGAIAGIDLLRLTVYRQALRSYWSNPLPAQESGQQASSR